ncbi:MAG: polymer-forming cytoskeletal protein [Kiloniellaceae bacterium]|jgi:cytoskeletal protein CcmA (bactofilin family)|nr:polymer-forming cytoskeletal protein [Kiloniellaceae bacterium]
MFGKRKGPSSPSEPGTPQRPEAAGLPGSGAGGSEGQPRSALGAKASATASGTGPAPKSQSRRAEGRLASAVEGRKLVVGREICLSGEIKTCEKLVVEGKVEADLRDSHSLEISEPGLFRGNATVEDCEISGTFEGELTVTGLLVVLPTGRVSGKIRYAEMELSRGARLSGDVDVLDEASLRRASGEGPKLAHDNSDSAGGDKPAPGAGKSQIG